jgi:hypothetical protein
MAGPVCRRREVTYTWAPHRGCPDVGGGRRWRALVETNSEHAGAKKAPRREGRRGAEQRAWAGGQIKRAEQLKHGRSDLVPLQSNFFSKNFAAGEFARQPTQLSLDNWQYLRSSWAFSQCVRCALRRTKTVSCYGCKAQSAGASGNIGKATWELVPLHSDHDSLSEGSG